MKKAKFLLVALLVVAMAVGAYGCPNRNSGSSNVITLKVWEDENNIDMLEPLADEFIADYARKYPKAPTLKIIFEPQSERTAVENVNLHGQSGNAADVFAFVHDNLGKAVTAGDIAEVLYPNELKAIHNDDSISAFTLDNKLYAYPITAESITVMYDKTKVTEQELASFENLKNSGKKLAWKTTSDAYYMFAFLTDVNLFGQNGKDKTQLKLDTSQAADNLYNLVSKYKNCLVDVEPEEAVSLLQSGEVVGIVSSPFLWATVKKALGANAAVAVLPTIDGQTLRPFSGYKGYGVSSYTKYPHLAHAFAAFLTNAENQYYRFVNNQLLPTVKDTTRFDQALQNDTQNKYAAALVMQESLENSLTMPNILAMGNYWAPMQDALTEIWNLSSSELTKEKISQILNTATTTIKNQIS
ncbi:MAG TPA: extracellular solute-binding protein [Clostridia bacterium]